MILAEDTRVSSKLMNHLGIDLLEMNLYYLTEIPFQKKQVSGSKNLLENLKTKGHHLFIITNGFREVQLKKMEETSLNK